jgi:site-specific recombinase XerC
MFSILLGTGIRLGSLVALNARDVNLAEGTVTIRAKGAREQTVFLNASLCRLLGPYIKTNAVTDGTPLFRSRKGNRLCPRQVQLRLRHWLKVAGITKPLSVHSLRHYAESRIMRSRSTDTPLWAAIAALLLGIIRGFSEKPIGDRQDGIDLHGY